MKDVWDSKHNVTIVKFMNPSLKNKFFYPIVCKQKEKKWLEK